MSFSPSREELLSAYLDDELSGDQRTMVEGWLAEDGSYRQLYDDLRAMRTSLQSLPRHKLEGDLAGSVLRRAERAVLAGDAPSGQGIAAAQPSTLRQWWSGRSWRMVVWPAVAAAAALAIALFDTREPAGQRQVAQQAPRESGDRMAANRADDAREAVPQMRAMPREEPPAAGAEYRDAQAPADRYAASRSGAAPAPGEPVAPPGAIAGRRMSQFGAGADLKKAEVAATAGVVVCDVAPQFIEQRSLEKLLDEKKLVWQRLQDKPPADEVRLQIEADRPSPIGLRYVVQATSDEVGAVVADLKSDDQKLVLKVQPTKADPPKQNKDAPPLTVIKEAQVGNARDARQPIIFWLRPTAAQDSKADDANP